MSLENQLKDYMQNHSQVFLDMLKEVVHLETPTKGNKEDLKICREYFENKFSDIGFKCSTIPSNDENYGDHLLMELGEGSEQILFVGHYDTVYDKGTFGDIWTEKDSKIWGPGVLDMKGGNVQVYMIARALIDLNLMPENKKIVFLLTSDEEAGSPTSAKLYMDEARKSKASLIMEPTMGDDIEDVTVGRFARGNYTFVAEGKPAHSGQEPENAESSITELVQQAAYLESLTNLEEGVTVACTCLNSGNKGWPTVPGAGELTIDARFVSNHKAEEYDAIFQQLKPYNPKVKITTKGGIEKPSFEATNVENNKLFEKAKNVGEKFNLNIKGSIGRAGTDGNFTSSVGCPTLDGLGLTGRYLHQPGDEYINVNDIAKRGAFVASLVLEILNETL